MHVSSSNQESQCYRFKKSIYLYGYWFKANTWVCSMAHIIVATFSAVYSHADLMSLPELFWRTCSWSSSCIFYARYKPCLFECCICASFIIHKQVTHCNSFEMFGCDFLSTRTAQQLTALFYVKGVCGSHCTIVLTAILTAAWMVSCLGLVSLTQPFWKERIALLCQSLSKAHCGILLLSWSQLSPPFITERTTLVISMR